MTFTPMTVPADNATGRLEVLVSEAVPGIVAVQQRESADGEIVFSPMHVPTGRLMGAYAFETPEACYDAIKEFWNVLPEHFREVLATGNIDAIARCPEIALAFLMVIREMATIRVRDVNPESN